MDEAFTLAVAVGSGALVVLAIVGAIRLTTIPLALYGTPLFLLSLHAVDGLWATSFEIAAFTATMVAGYYLTRAFGSWTSHSTIGHETPKRPAPAAGLAQALRSSSAYVVVRTGALKRAPSARPRTYAGPIAIFTSAFCVYNFAVIGLPILSPNVEVQRLDIGSSGLLGVPSRMYLFGVVFALAVAIAEARSRSIPVARSPWVRLAYATLVVTRVISGFKSGVAEIVIDTVLLSALSLGGLQVTRYLGRLAVGAIVAVAFVFVIGSTYQSYTASGNSVLTSLETRITAGTATPVWIVMNSTPSSLNDQRGPIQMDFDYFRYEYLHIGPAEPYGFTRLIATASVGESPYVVGEVAPVTLSYAPLYYEFGWFGLLPSLALGVVLRLSESRAYRRRSSPIAFGLWASVAVASVEFVSRGELLYALINWAATCFLLVAVGVAWNLLLRNPNASSVARPRRRSRASV